MDKIDLAVKQLEQLARGKNVDEDTLLLNTREIFSWAARLKPSSFAGGFPSIYPNCLIFCIVSKPV
jgi:hypothetical protein